MAVVVARWLVRYLDLLCGARGPACAAPGLRRFTARIALARLCRALASALAELLWRAAPGLRRPIAQIALARLQPAPIRALVGLLRLRVQARAS